MSNKKNIRFLLEVLKHGIFLAFYKNQITTKLLACWAENLK